MTKKLAVFDIDGTLFRWQLYHELVFELKDQGFFTDNEALSLDSALTNWQGKKVSWREYEMLVIHTIHAHLDHINPAELEAAAKIVVDRSGHKIYNYTAKLLRTLHDDGYHTLALSASQQEIAEQFAARYEFDDCIAAVYERSDGKYTGTQSRIVHGRKDEVIREYLANHSDLTLEGSIAVGDSDGDITMLQMVDQPIAFNPSEELLQLALASKWRVVIERKNIAYTLEDNNGSVVLAKTDAF